MKTFEEKFGASTPEGDPTYDPACELMLLHRRQGWDAAMAEARKHYEPRIEELEAEVERLRNPKLDDNEKNAFAWAMATPFHSVSADYARTLAKCLQRLGVNP